MNQQTLDLLKDLAAKLGTTAEHLWGVLMRQAYVSFASDLFLYLVAGVAVYCLIRGAIRCFDFNSEEAKLNAVDFSGWILCLFAVFIGFLVVLNMPDTITKIINPEYWALQQILETVKGGK